jgi:large subunit ribosomal protein L10
MKELKENIISELVARLNASPFMIVADYTALTVSQFDELRTKLDEVGASANVTKNTYAKRAADELKYPEEIAQYLKGQSVIVTGEQDVCAAAKAIKDYHKANEKPEMRAGVLDGKMLTPEELNALAALPPMDVLRAMLLGTLQAPASTLVRLLNEPASGLARVLKAKGEQG